MKLSAADRAEYNQIKKKNDEKIDKFCNKNREIKAIDLKSNIKYCLYENLKPDRICNKSKLIGGELYHYHYRRLCVIEYTVVYIGKCYIPKIYKIYKFAPAHKRYNRDNKSVKRRKNKV